MTYEDFTAGLPSIAEQREIEAHNAPIIEALSTTVLMAQRLFGMQSSEYQAACRIFDAASKIAADFRRIGEVPA